MRWKDLHIKRKLKNGPVSLNLSYIYIICSPLLIVAGLLPATVQSHHPVAFTPHILANYPLGWVAGSSPKKRHSFPQLNSVKKERKMCLWSYMAQRFCSDPQKVLISVNPWIYPADPCTAAASKKTMIFVPITLSAITLSRWFTSLCCLQKKSQLLSWFWSHCFCFTREHPVVSNMCVI